MAKICFSNSSWSVKYLKYMENVELFSRNHSIFEIDAHVLLVCRALMTGFYNL